MSFILIKLTGFVKFSALCERILLDECFKVKKEKRLAINMKKLPYFGID